MGEFISVQRTGPAWFAAQYGYAEYRAVDL